MTLSFGGKKAKLKHLRFMISDFWTLLCIYTRSLDLTGNKAVVTAVILLSVQNGLRLER